MTTFYSHYSVRLPMDDSSWSLGLDSAGPDKTRVSFFWKDKPYPTHETIVENDALLRAVKLVTGTP